MNNEQSDSILVVISLPWSNVPVEHREIYDSITFDWHSILCFRLCEEEPISSNNNKIGDTGLFGYATFYTEIDSSFVWTLFRSWTTIIQKWSTDWLQKEPLTAKLNRMMKLLLKRKRHRKMSKKKHLFRLHYALNAQKERYESMIKRMKVEFNKTIAETEKRWWCVSLAERGQRQNSPQYLQYCSVTIIRSLSQMQNSSK